MKKTLVGVVMGSDTDLPIMEETLKVLDFFGISYEVIICSAHRSPKRASEFAKTSNAKGIDASVI